MFQPQRAIFRVKYFKKHMKGLYTITLLSSIKIKIITIYEIHATLSHMLVEILINE
jgi:hypothetical protein